jgi:hypothetical protein
MPFARPLRDRVVLIASYESVFSGEVRDDAASASFDLNHSELAGGVRLRQPFAEHALEFDVTFGQLRSGLGDPEGLSRVPELRYTQFRSALALDLRFDELSLRGSAGLRIPTSFGQAAEPDWFPRIDGTGVEGAVGLGYAVGEGVSIAVGGSVRRFVLQMNSRPEDAREGLAEVAGGAVDLYLSGYFGLNVSL